MCVSAAAEGFAGGLVSTSKERDPSYVPHSVDSSEARLKKEKNEKLIIPHKTVTCLKRALFRSLAIPEDFRSRSATKVEEEGLQEIFMKM